MILAWLGQEIELEGRDSRFRKDAAPGSYLSEVVQGIESRVGHPQPVPGDDLTAIEHPGAAGEPVELIDVMGPAALEIDFLQERDIDIELFDDGSDGAKGGFKVGGGFRVVVTVPFRSPAVTPADIPSQNLEPHVISFIMKIICVDCKYVEPEFAGAWLLVRKGRGMFIECNTNHAIPFLREAAAREGLSPEDIDGLIVTHIHLDHAGGAGLFLKAFPQARLYAHPRAARHAIDPSRLVASATRVYGEAFMQKLYGEILPCEEERVQVLNDGDSLFFQGVELEIKHTLGHAKHHLVVFEPTTRTLFTGDSAGVSYPAVNRKHGCVALPSTSPTDFDGPAALAVLDWIEKLSPDRLAPTHFGFIEKGDIPRALQMLRDQLGFAIHWQRQIREGVLTEDELHARMRSELGQYFETTWGIRLDEKDREVLRVDLEVNAQGLWFASRA
jgi:glyoxylase-like metal-dependent hydrolase (beta-lactamase superfamily II)